jgi:hypothetical protein
MAVLKVSEQVRDADSDQSACVSRGVKGRLRDAPCVATAVDVAVQREMTE